MKVHYVHHWQKYGRFMVQKVVDAITEKGYSMEQQDVVYDIHFCPFIWSTYGNNKSRK